MHKYFNTEDLTSLKKIMKLYTRLLQAANNNYCAEKAVEVKAEPIKKEFFESLPKALLKERILEKVTEEEQAEIDKKVEEMQFYLDHPEKVEEWAGFDKYSFAECEDEVWGTDKDPYEYYAAMEIKPCIASVKSIHILFFEEKVMYGDTKYPIFDLLTEAEKAEYYASIEALREECIQKEAEIKEKRAEAQEILQNFDLMEVVRRNTFINNVEFLRFEGKNTKIYLICDHEGHKKEIEFFPSTQERDRDNTERLLELLAVQKDPWSLKDC